MPPSGKSVGAEGEGEEEREAGCCLVNVPWVLHTYPPALGGGTTGNDGCGGREVTLLW